MADQQNGVKDSKKRKFTDEAPEEEQTGEVYVPAKLPTLDSDQLRCLSMAKKYCQDITSKFQVNRQAEQQVGQMQALQDAANQQRALLLMSRIYIGSINFELGEEAIRNAFQPFGTIKTINMSWDSATMKHKGYSFIEYETAEAAQLALEQMNGVILGGRNIKVGRPNNVPQAAPIIAKIQERAAILPRIYIASIHNDLCASDVKSVFEAFGKIKKIELAPDSAPGKHRGWGYIDYDVHKSAADAIASMNLFDLGGKFLRVGRALTPPLPLYPPNAGPVLPSLLTSAALGYTSPSSLPVNSDTRLCIVENPQPKAAQKPTKDTATPTLTVNNAQEPSLAEIQAKLHQANEEKEATGTEMTTLQQEEEVSISGSNARLMVMQKLSRKSESRVLVIKNMVDVDEIDDDLEYEVTHECEKYGVVEKVVLYQEKQGIEETAECIVKVFVVFATTSEAERAVKVLNGRWFGGRVLDVQLYDQSKFNAKDLSQ